MTGLHEVLESFRNHGGRAAIIYRSGIRRFTCSYAELYILAVKMAAYLEQQGVGRGDKVLLWGPNSTAWVAAFWGIVARGGVVVPVDFLSGLDRAKGIALHSRATFAVQSRARVEHLEEIPSVMLEDLEALLESVVPRDLPPVPSPDDICELVYTSGTTGAPKGVVLTHRNLATNLHQVTGQFPEISSEYSFLSLLPLSHMFEQMAGFLAPLSLGGTIVYVRTLKPSSIMEAFSEEDIWAVVAVPRLLQLLKSSVEQAFAAKGLGGLLQRMLSLSPSLPPLLRRILFTPLRRRFGRNFNLFVSGGAPLSAELFRFWNAAGFTVVEGYGLSECSPVLTANMIERQVPGAVGWPLPGVEIRLVNGEIQVRGGNVFPGYYENEAATQGAFTADGWFRTGDLGAVDSSGALVVRGRAKDLIVTAAGINVYPEELEEVLAKVAGVRECCVIGMPRGGGEEVHAVIVPDGSGRPLGEIVNEANGAIDDLHRITGYTLWSEQELPKTTTLKVKKFAVKEHLLEKADVGSAVLTATADRFIRLVAGVLGLPLDEVGEESFLVADLGLTSIARLELVTAIEQEFRIDLDDAAIGPQTRVGDVRGMISRRERVPAPRGLRLWTSTLLFRGVRVLADTILHRPLLSLFVSLSTEGAERLAGLSGPVIFIANHTSYLDQPCILFSLPASLRYRCATAAWAEFFFVNFKNILQRIWKLSAFEYCSLALGVFPLPQSTGFRASLCHMGRLADRGMSLLVFPEGARSREGALQPFQQGLAIMVKELSLPVVPVAINGLDKVLPAGALWPKQGRVVVRFGEPLNLSRTSSAEIITSAEQAVQGLLD
ncbi:MAG TPA: AMP-binding protein [Geobacteraceae bacterium]|nr:AMP-binding protein [Geobacteraceae bacterium]